MTDRIRAGIIGAGFMGEVHARAIRRSGAIVGRVVGSSRASSRNAAERLAPEVPTGTADELLASDDIDVVHVCTPNASHADLARRALRAGKHVVCEKPLAVSVVEALEVTALAAEAAVVATVPFVYRFHPMIREARERVGDGRTGSVRVLHGSYLQDWLAGSDDDWRVDPALGGPSRAFADIGVHWCDLAEFVTGHRITRVSAIARTVVPERGGRRVETEDVAGLLFETDQGAVGSVTVSQVSPGRKNRLWLSIDGAAESLVFDQETPETLWIGGRDTNRQLLRGTTESPAAARYSVLPAGHPQGYQDCFDAFVADTYAAISGEWPDGLPTFADGLRAARITDAVLTSVRSAGWEAVAA